MGSSRRRRFLPLCSLVSIVIALLIVTGCGREEEPSAPEGSPPRVVGAAEPASAATGVAITKAGVNPPTGRTFTCWIGGSGFQAGDKVLVNGTTEIPTTLGNPGLVTFVGGVELLEGRTALTLVVVRPGTDVRSNEIEAPIPAAPKG